MPPHCDTKDGPVVQAALRALDIRRVEEALRFAPEEAADEIRAAFGEALAAREAGPAAQNVANLYFAETVVRLHRAGEGASYTGLKPEGLEVGPVIPIAERAIESGSDDELATYLSDTLHQEVKRRLDHVMMLQAKADRGLAEARSYTSAMLGFQVWSHRLHRAMVDAAHEGPGHHH